MELLVLTVSLGLVAAIAVRFGADSRPHLRATDHRHADFGQRRPREELDRLLAHELRDAARQSSAISVAAPVEDVRFDDAHFAAVGLRLETARARAFAAALCQAAVEEIATGDGGWPGRAVDRLVRAVSVEHLAGVLEDVGPGRVAVATDVGDDAGAETLRALLIHLLRDRLQDALRLSAGRCPFWSWDAPDAVDPSIVRASGAEDGAGLVQDAA